MYNLRIRLILSVKKKVLIIVVFSLRNSVSKIETGDEIKLEKIFIYPIKSCAAMVIREPGWPIDSRGFKYDRQWMIVTENGVALTQKAEPLLCLINPCLSINSPYLTLSAFGKQQNL